MNRIKCFLGALMVTVVCSASAQLLFTNLPASVTGLQALTNLQAVIYGGNSNFVAVGANEAYTCGSFQANQSWLNSGSWVTKQISAAALGLDAITFENNIFIATGNNNAIFNAPNAVGSAGLVWATNAFHIFPSTAVAAGIAYNSNVLVAVAEANQISYSSTNLPTAATWPQGSTPGGFSIIESFRGVAAYGASGFVACGIFGDVRFSSNGSNWLAKANGAVGESDLFGIASAGQTLVSVGATNGGAANNGAILFSTDGGTVWQQATNPPGGIHPLNAVAYTSPGFIAVGNNGQVLASPNGVGWTLLTNTVSAANLNGVAFATNGLMAGVGELVGNSGTVILAGYAPGTPTNPIGQTNCATYPNPPNNQLSVSVVTDANHPAGTVTVDWYDALGHLLTNGTTTFFPTNNPNLVTSNAPVTFTFNAVERDLRTGFTSAATPVTLEINPRPTTTLVPLNTTDCNVGDAFVLTNVLTGIGPWTVSWNDGTVQPASGTPPLTLTRTVFPTNTLPNTAVANIYYVTNVTSADTCLGNLPGDILGTNTITINPRPTAALTPLNITDCDEGNPYVLTVALTGIGPWTVFWNDGTAQATNGSAPVTLTRTVIPHNSFGANVATTNIYFVTVVSNDDTCEGNQPGDITGNATIIINPRPTATLTPLNSTNCNIGLPVTLFCHLTGLGPWTVFWNDGTIQSASGTAPQTLTRTIVPTDPLPDGSSNNVYYVTAVTNSDTCIGNQPGDLIGTNVVVINPRPTASMPNLNIQQCNEGGSYTLTNTLHGLGPWTLYWNDGTVQVDSQVGPGPAILTRTVFPTNSFGVNTTSNNMYAVTVVSNNDMCAGNQPGDITGGAFIFVDPRPTATLATLVTNVCNNGNSYTLAYTLTGIPGTFAVSWNDGTIQNVSGPGPDTRTVFPTNTLPNVPFTNSYYITNVVDLFNGCTGDHPGDITGTNLIIVKPLDVATLTITTNDFAVSTNGVSSGLLETVSNPSGSTFNLTVGFQYLQNGVPVPLTSQTLSVTNHLAFTGIGPWTVVLADGTGSTSTNTFSGNGNFVWQETISTNSDTNFTFSVQSLQSTNTGCSGASTASYDVLVYDAPTALVYTTNIFCGSATNIATISAVLGGFGPWTNVVWSDGFTNALVTSNPLSRNVPTPANGTLARIINNYTIVSLTDMFGAATTSSNDLTGSAQVIVDPFSSSPPVAQSSLNESCATVPIPLSVTVPAGFTANWFDANTNLLTNGVTAYTPPAPALAATNIYLVAEIYNDTNLNDGCDSPFAAITNIFDNCSQTTSISLAGTNVVISWTGNFILQSTTNLLPPTMWMNVSTGALGPNFLTNPVSQPPVDFFRLTSPTN